MQARDVIIAMVHPDVCVCAVLGATGRGDEDETRSRRPHLPVGPVATSGLIGMCFFLLLIGLPEATTKVGHGAK